MTPPNLLSHTERTRLRQQKRKAKHKALVREAIEAERKALGFFVAPREKREVARCVLRFPRAASIAACASPWHRYHRTHRTLAVIP